MAEPAEGPSSQNLSALLKLRELILSGELKAGERLSELALVERLKVSRTPIRTAMMRLEQEGLAHPIPTGGFAVSAFSERDIHAAIEVRGTLEGLAARLAAERGHDDASFDEMRLCLAALDALVFEQGVTPENFSRYVELNGKFHQHVVDLADSAVLSRQIARAVVASLRLRLGLRHRAGQSAGGAHSVHRRAGPSPLHRCARSRRMRESAPNSSCASMPGWRAAISNSR